MSGRGDMVVASVSKFSICNKSVFGMSYFSDSFVTSQVVIVSPIFGLLSGW